ncbi:uncharacterized protein V6R79_018979 [Siganus canaliculatus]
MNKGLAYVENRAQIKDRGETADYESKLDVPPITVAVPVEICAMDHVEDNVERIKPAEEATGDAEVNGESEDFMSHEGSVVFDFPIHDDNRPPSLLLETPERQNISSSQEKEDDVEEEKPVHAPAGEEGVDYEQRVKLFQELCEQRDKAGQHNRQLQIKLLEYFRKKACRDDKQQERELLASEQLQEYERTMKILTGLKEQLRSDSETAEQQAQELSLQSQQKLDKVENEWRAFMALKQDVAVSALSRRLGKQAAQAKVESTLAAERLHQEELTTLRLQHIKLRLRICRLEAALRDREEHGSDPLQLQFEQLQAERLEWRKQAEKQQEEALKTQRKISSSLEVLSNVKEKLFWSQMDVQAKREQLEELEDVVVQKRDLLTRTKQERNSLQKDNQRMKERRGLLGNRVLLRDFEDTVDATEHLEEHLENLKAREAEISFMSGRLRKKLETSS